MRRFVLHHPLRPLSALAVLVVLLVVAPGWGSASAVPVLGAPHAAPPEGALSTSTLSSASSGEAALRVASPQVTSIFDWDTQPLVLPPSFPLSEVAGEGAVMAASDPLRSVVLFGGEAPDGLQNYTVTVSQLTGGFDVSQPATSPSPRANSSFITVDSGRFAVLFGGLTNLATQTADNETWVFDYQNRTWTNHSGPVAPPPREAAAFAAPVDNGTAVLEGGWDPGYSVGGAGASITWNDTWLLNLSTFNWSVASPIGAPRPMFGSSMFFDPVAQRFLLFGGCGSFCSNALYAYRPGGNWTRVGESGDVPSPRGAASAGYSTAWGVWILAAGFVWGGNDYFALNDTFQFTPSTSSWDLVVGAEGPSARFSAPAAFLDANNCPGLLLYGGSSAVTLPPADGWFLDSNPDLQSGCNIWGGDQVGGGGGPPANCSTPESLQVQVIDNGTKSPVTNATVELNGVCGTVTLKTSSFGLANFTALPNETAHLIVSAPRYHLNQTFVNLSLANRSHLPVFLDRLPIIDVRAWGLTYPNVIAPLANVSIVAGSIVPLGLTNASGWLNVSDYGGPVGSTQFNGFKPLFSNVTVSEFVPYTGTINISMTLLADGTLEIHVVEYPDGAGVAFASGVILPVGSSAFGAPTDYATNSQGWFNSSVPQQYYSIIASAPGFVANQTHIPVFIPWINPTLVVINLTLLRGADLSVRLLNVRTLDPISPGLVQVGYFAPENTSASGWANFTDILPPGWYTITGSATGYESNATALDLTYLTKYPALVLLLTPLPGRTIGCTPAHNDTPGAFRLLPPSGASLDLFLLAPVLLALAGIGYAFYVRRQTQVAP